MNKLIFITFLLSSCNSVSTPGTTNRMPLEVSTHRWPSASRATSSTAPLGMPSASPSTLERPWLIRAKPPSAETQTAPSPSTERCRMNPAGSAPVKGMNWRPSKVTEFRLCWPHETAYLRVSDHSTVLLNSDHGATPSLALPRVFADQT